MSVRSAPRVLSPIADEFTGDYAVYRSEADVVALTAPVAAFLELCDTERVRPVLLTRADASLSAACATMLGDVRGFWAVQDARGVREAVSGRTLREFADLWQVHEAPQPSAHPSPTLSLTVDVYLRHRADLSTRIGAAAQTCTEQLGAPGLERWGVWEPLGRRWDTGAVTALLRTQMPQSGPIQATGAGTTFVTLRVGRTQRGLLEHMRLSASPADGDPREAALALLTRLEREADVMIGLVSTRSSEADGGVRPGGYPAAAPLAALLGPGLTHQLGIEPDALAEHHEIRRLGRAKTPSTLIGFGHPENPWIGVLELAARLDPRRVLAAIGVEVPDAH